MQKFLTKYLIGLIVVSIIILIPFTIWLNNLTSDDKTKGVVITIILLCLIFFLLYWIISSIRKIDSDRIGCILEFGRPVIQVGAGICFVPLWFCELKNETRLAIEEKFPDDINTPLKIIHKNSTNTFGDVLKARVVTSASLVFRYKIIDFTAFIKSIGNRLELKKQVRDVLLSRLQIECSKFTASENLERLAEINSALKSEIEKNIDSWGIEIINVHIANFDLGNSIIDAQNIINTGIAEAEVTRIYQSAKGRGIKELAKELGIDESIVVYKMETVANMISKMNTKGNSFDFNGNNEAHQFLGLLISMFKGGNDSNKNLQ